MTGPRDVAPVLVFSDTVELGDQNRGPAGTARCRTPDMRCQPRELDELHTGFGGPGRDVAYCRPVGMLLAQQRPDAGRCAKHGRAGLHATPWDPTAFP